ncbi:S8 family peptidase [Streptomyces sp. NPDC020965]|uniref:S8 family peptidase n=1 Tax=Streptomyces sp. NPDC020965 TaxID=3365105 RepID=UPI00379C4F3E
MRRQVKRACISTIATAAAVALTAGMTGPSSVAAERTEQQPAATTAKAKAGVATKHRVTLVTGDRVIVDGKGRAVGFERAKGREAIPIATRTVAGHTFVIPEDARRLIEAGRLDRRLFDVTELSGAASRKARADGIKVIVGYGGASAGAARAEVRSAGDTQVRRSLPGLNADAVTTPDRDVPALWEALTRTEQRGARTTSAGISRIWLDGVRRAQLDTSVKQIGAPQAWASGYDGTGVTIAVLDTGVDVTHPDLASRVVGAENFTSSKDTKDRYGHGTHVASIAAGTGAKSGGKFKGVAPGAKVLNGKVLGDDGSGFDSGIIAGIDWAVARGADIVNLSLGGYDTPELDPLEAHVNKVAAEKDVLFAVSAGNNGPRPGTVGSPGSAEGALTVGAVDDKELMADFSSVGPRKGDNAVKPDVTAPGVNTTAAAVPGSVIDDQVGQQPPGYSTISGTSMAAPHAAGAAALLKQRTPALTGRELKQVLIGSTKSGGHGIFQQGSGRIAVDQAIRQTVIAEESSLNFGTQQWPHTDDTPVTKKITYRNLGTQAVALRMTIAATGPTGRPTPIGFFSVGQRNVTVPAGGTASVDVTTDTRLGGDIVGAYSATVVATGGGQTVRTTGTVDREVESYDLTVHHLDREGAPSKDFHSVLLGLSGPGAEREIQYSAPTGTAKVRVPKGGYTLDARRIVDPADESKGGDWLVQPLLDVSKDTTITVDARGTKPVSITVPDARATPEGVGGEYQVALGDSTAVGGWYQSSFANIRTGQLGGAATGVRLKQKWESHWVSGTATEYNTVLGGTVKRLATGFTKRYTAGELTKVTVGLGSSARGTEGAVVAWAFLPGTDGSYGMSVERRVPTTVTMHLSTAPGTTWQFDYDQFGEKDAHGNPARDIAYSTGEKRYRAGKAYTVTINTAVAGPSLSDDVGLYRTGDTLTAYVPMFNDGADNWGMSAMSAARTTLHRGKVKLFETDDRLEGEHTYKIPSAPATYTLATSLRRSPKIAAASSRIDASWTFRSTRPAGGDEAFAKLPLSVARFTPSVALDGTAPAGRLQSVPVRVQGAAAGANLKSLRVLLSYDYGVTWATVPVRAGKIVVKNPAKGKGIAFRAEIADKKGNTSRISIQNAYYGG